MKHVYSHYLNDCYMQGLLLKKIKREQVLIRDQILHIYLFVHSFIQQIQQSRMGEEKDG